MSNIEIDVNALSEVVNDKADRDLGNLTKEGEAKIGKSGGGGGLPPSVCRNMVINTNNSTVNLKWQDPDDTYINGFYYKPIWAESVYYDKIKAYDVHPEQFPLEIYDVTHKKENMVKMSVEDLKKLSDFLYAYQKLYFEQKQAQQAI